MRMVQAVLIVAACAAGLGAQETAPKAVFPPLPAQLMIPSPPPSAALSGDVDALLNELDTGNARARLAAVKALGVPGDVRAVPALGNILLRLNEPVKLRAAAALALGRIRNWRAASFLEQGLAAGVREVRFSSALALGKAKAPGSLAVLVRTLRDDPDWWVRFAAALALGDDRDPASVEALAAAAESEKEWQVRMQAVRSLARIGSRGAAYALAKPLGDRDAAVRAATAQALGEIGGLDSINLLANALHAETEKLPRAAMADAIKKLLSHP